MLLSFFSAPDELIAEIQHDIALAREKVEAPAVVELQGRLGQYCNMEQ